MVLYTGDILPQCVVSSEKTHNFRSDDVSAKKTGFGTQTGFALAAAGSAIGLGNLWGFPYKVSANGGAAYLFVYIICIVLIGATTMMAEFAIGKNAHANTLGAFQKVSPKLGWAGLIAVLVPLLILCYYIVLGGFSLKFALNSYAGNEGIFASFAANAGDVILHTLLFTALVCLVVSRGVHGGIEKTSKILMPAVFFFLIVISMVTLSLGEGVREGIAYYLHPDFSALTPTAILSAMGQAFFSLSLGCGVMISYGSYAGRDFDIAKTTVAVCVMDVIITTLMGFAIFPAVFHYAAVSGVSAAELGLGSFGLLFTTLSTVFEDIPVFGRTVSLLFFSMAVIAALTSAISLLEAATQYIIQRGKVFRSKAALAASAFCFAAGLPVIYSLGASLNGQEVLTVFGRNVFDFLELITNTLLMPICALLSCLAASMLLRRRDLGAGRYFTFMVRCITPALIVVIEAAGIYELVFPRGQFSGSGLGIVLTALGIAAVCAAVYFAFLKNADPGCNADEFRIDALEAEKRRAGLARRWSRPESEDRHE